MIRSIIQLIVKPLLREPALFCVATIAMVLPHWLDALPEELRLLTLRSLRNLGIVLALSAFLAWCLTWLVCLLKHKQLAKTLIYAALLTLLAVNLFLFWGFGTLLSPWILLLIKETTSGETGEFLRRYMLSGGAMKCYACIAAILLLIYLGERKEWQLNAGRRTEGILAIALSPLLALGSYLTWQAATLFSMQSQYAFELWQDGRGYYAKQSTPTNLLYSSLYLHVSGADNQQAIASCIAASRVPATCSETDSLCVVMVIGESFSKRHTPLYGYKLNTTPRLATLHDQGNLFVFTDAVAPYNMTTFSVKNILSTNSLSAGESWQSRPSFPVVFKRAGFHVSMWDNQRPNGVAANNYDYALGSYLYAPEMLRLAYCEHNTRTYDYDLALEELFEQHLQRQAARGKRHRLCLHIFHLMGQHSDAACRFPPAKELQVFKPDDVGREELSLNARRAISDYDNATHYNDLVVSRIIRFIEAKPAILLYLSDHGEELFDYRNFLGRSHERRKSAQAIRCQYEIPLLLWCSERYMSTHAAEVAAIRGALDRPATADDCCHMLFSLAGISTPFYSSRHDVLSPEYSPGRRILQGYIDYDAATKSTP